MKEYNEYFHYQHGHKRVKHGFSWPGFFFTVFWLAAKGVWDKFALWATVWVVGAILIGYLRDSQSSTDISRALWLVAIILNWVFHLVPGLCGNKWYMKSLEGRGFYVKTKPEEAQGDDISANSTPMVAAGGRNDIRINNEGDPRSAIVVLYIMAVLVFIMVLYPPYVVEFNNVILDTGYGYIFDMPQYVTGRIEVPSKVNVPNLAVQVIGVLIVGGLVYFAQRRK